MQLGPSIFKGVCWVWGYFLSRIQKTGCCQLLNQKHWVLCKIRSMWTKWTGRYIQPSRTHQTLGPSQSHTGCHTQYCLFCQASECCKWPVGVVRIAHFESHWKAEKVTSVVSENNKIINYHHAHRHYCKVVKRGSLNPGSVTEQVTKPLILAVRMMNPDPKGCCTDFRR